MPGGQCKAAACGGGCLDAIVVDNAREMTEVFVKLAASGALSEEQMEAGIDLFSDFEEEEVRRRKRQDRILRDKIKEILGV